eukprot:NODE_986_length_1520_cov_59.592965_g975_i0.p1 GENE.NODE_986_length_1520_cov_59.592965_g975_i0~~NODE_986_length_1520_cov_59.592965_g975_i0.p1  ORF type:complete len:403 (-),score=10.13 NODE_986_length_1520_cov_59.592965_g975_i0:264-1472(-)
MPGIFILVMMLCLLLHAARKQNTQFQRFDVQTDRSMCLDGSRPVVYARPNQRSSKWLVLFPGGGWCHTAVGCRRRSPGQKLGRLGSSTSYTNFLHRTETRHWGGVWDAKLGPFNDGWRRAVVMYCDGSSWLGDADKPVQMAPNLTVHFRGNSNLRGSISLLLNQLGMRNATEVVFTGHSAGAAGLLLNAHTIRELIPSHIRVSMIVCNGLFLDVQATWEGRRETNTMQRAFHTWGARTSVNQDCLNRKSPERAAECVMPHYAAAFLPQSVPIFLAQTTYDSHALKVSGGTGNSSYSAAEYVTRARIVGAAQTSAVDRAAVSGVFQPSCGRAHANHPFFVSPECLQYRIRNMTVVDAVRAWYSATWNGTDAQRRRQWSWRDACRYPCITNGDRCTNATVHGHT